MYAIIAPHPISEIHYRLSHRQAAHAFGKKISPGTLQQYQCTYLLLEEFERQQEYPLRIILLHRRSLRVMQKEKNYWIKFFRKFTGFLYNQKGCYDRYTSSVVKIIKAFFHYLAVEKGLPVGEFHKRFRIPFHNFTPVILSPSQLRYLITDTDFEQSLQKSLQRTKDIFVFGCIVALRFQDLMRLTKNNIQYTSEGTYVVLHTQKTGAEVKILLPAYATAIIDKYKRKAGQFVLPRLSGSNLNLQIKAIMKKAGWDYSLPKIRYKQGRPTEIKTKKGDTYKFYNHITIHSMRRTAITTLLLMGVDETSVRRISGHAPGS